MKKIVVLLLALCMIFMLCACGEEAVQEVVSDSAEAEAVTTVEDGVLHMSTNAAFPPYEMVKDGGDELINKARSSEPAVSLDLD